MAATFKTYEDFKMITDKTALQYDIVHNQMKTGAYGLRYTDDEYIGIALSSLYGSIGTKFRIELSSGEVLKAIKVDEKQEQHLINNCTDQNGAMVEFVVDTEKLPEIVILHGNLNEIFNGVITKIEKEK